MFRNHRNLFTAATILALFLLTSLPAAAAGSTQPRGGESAWENLVSRALVWLGNPGSGFSALWGEYSSYIDPNGQPAPNTSSYIDPLGHTSTGASTDSDSSSQIDPNGRP
jgi:hypothetical protein